MCQACPESDDRDGLIAGAILAGKIALGVAVWPLALALAVPLELGRASINYTVNIISKALNPARWPYLGLLLVLNVAPAVAQWPRPTPLPNDCLYLQHHNVSSQCSGGYYSVDIAPCLIDPWGQCPQEGGDTMTGALGTNALVFRYSMPILHEDWGSGEYIVTTKISLDGGADMSYRVRLSRMSDDCRTTYQVLGELGPFPGPVAGGIPEFRFPAVASYRESATDRLVVDFIASGTGVYTFGTSYGHAEHVYAPFLVCSGLLPTATAMPTPTPTPEWLPVGAIADLGPGDVIRSRRGSEEYIIMRVSGQRATGVRMIEITEPSAWMRRRR